MPVVFGDDLTDEYAFRAAHEHGGLAIAVGPLVAASADLVLEGPRAVRIVLEALAGRGAS
jgi:trehalose-6-phosphatase